MIPDTIAGMYIMKPCRLNEMVSNNNSLAPPLYRLQVHEVEGKLKFLAEYQHMAEELCANIRTSAGPQNNKLNVELEERLTALLLKVDAVETEGDDQIRSARKQVVFVIQNALKFLENLS